MELLSYSPNIYSGMDCNWKNSRSEDKADENSQPIEPA